MILLSPFLPNELMLSHEVPLVAIVKYRDFILRVSKLDPIAAAGKQLLCHQKIQEDLGIQECRVIQGG